MTFANNSQENVDGHMWTSTSTWYASIFIF